MYAFNVIYKQTHVYTLKETRTADANPFKETIVDYIHTHIVVCMNSYGMVMVDSFALSYVSNM